VSLVQSFGLGRNAAGKIRGFETRLESKLETLDGGWISRCTCVNYNTIAIKLLVGNSGCNGNLLAKGHRVDSSLLHFSNTEPNPYQRFEETFLFLAVWLLVSQNFWDAFGFTGFCLLTCF
jgi:hypothetical protein